jgi:Fe-S-cluster containining protein
VSQVFALSIHAHYRCRHSGVCCTADWDVPVELPVFRTLEAALRARTLVPQGTPHDDGDLLVTEDLPEDAAAILARTEAGRCVFHHAPSGLCAVHRDLGEPALPATCRHFPRLAVTDPRGTFISLTHFCPTAAAMLFDDVPIAIVDNPPAFPPGEYEGLTADPEAFPPLLTPRMLMDLPGYAAWERHMVARCANTSVSVESILATLARDVERLHDFDPARDTLVGRIASLPPEVQPADAPVALRDSLAWMAGVLAAVPEDLRPVLDDTNLEAAYQVYVRPSWGEWQAPLRRYLAAKAFANWTAYQGRSLMAVVRGLTAAIALVRVEAARRCRDARITLDGETLREAIRQADFMLNHLAVGEELAATWSRGGPESVG